jgi:hypothetical protein
MSGVSTGQVQWRHRYGWEDNIKIDLKELGTGGRVSMNTVMNLPVP